MKKNPKVLYSYMNRENKRKVTIGPFNLGEGYIYDNETIGKILVGQYKSQFNKNTMETNIEDIKKLLDDIDDDDLVDITITEEDIIEAIDELDENSSAGPDEIPAIFLKKTKKKQLQKP